MNGYVAPKLPRDSQRGLELGVAVQRVSAVPCLHLHELPDKFEALGSCELTERVPLGLNPETGAPLPGG